MISNPAAARFGHAVSIDNNRVLIGLPNADVRRVDSGAALVYVLSGGTWVLEGDLVDSVDGGAGDLMGFSVSLSGNRALVGALLDSHSGYFDCGSAYVFVRSGSTWVLESKLTAYDPGTDDHFGVSVALSQDRALIAADVEDAGGRENSGSAYVFVRAGTTWSHEAKLVATDALRDDRFGSSVSLSGERALIGAFGTDDAGSESGSAYVFVRSGSMWSQEAKLVATDAASGDSFGYAVSLEGSHAIIGARGDDANGQSSSGSVYVFGDIGAVSAETGAPSGVSLAAPVPNPAATRATLALTVDRPQGVRATVVDALGREVAVAFDGVVTDGAQLVVATASLTPGVYVVRVTGASFDLSRRLTVVR